jgi:hypothetical protein
VREHRGVEKRRQLSDLAILRLGAWIEGDTRYRCPPHRAAWYRKSQATFSDAIAAVRVLWSPQDFSMSRHGTETLEIPAHLLADSWRLYASQPKLRKAELSARAKIGDSQQTNREVGKKATNRRGRFR